MCSSGRAAAEPLAIVTPMGDCERLHDGMLAEPVNALSSLAYVAAGVYVFRRHDRLQGAALVAVGVGSVADLAGRAETPDARDGDGRVVRRRAPAADLRSHGWRAL